MFCSQREYWTERYERQGPTYVAKGGSAESYDAQIAVVEPLLEQLVPQGGRVLDFGCGPGRFRPFLEERSAEYVGVDAIPGLGTVELGDELPGGFDCAVAIMVLQHITDDDEYEHWLGQLLACLKPGGVLVVFDHQPPDGPVEFDDHMRPRGMFPIMERPEVGNLQGLGLDFDGHWCGGFWTKNCDEEPGDAPTLRAENDEGGYPGGMAIDGEMPEVVHISSDLLASSLSYAIAREGDLVDINATNGRWTYTIIGWRDRASLAVCRLVSPEDP